MVIVQVYDSWGRPVSGADVYIRWDGGMMQTWSQERTDGNGRAYFNVGTGSGHIRVNGKIVHTGYLQGTIKVTA
ncbi:MAG: hypothetical protein KIT87_28990 [Anaerolineae bacterium]|nr:hypothetical protein [Anaerolineae bacterium]